MKISIFLMLFFVSIKCFSSVYTENIYLNDNKIIDYHDKPLGAVLSKSEHKINTKVINSTTNNQQELELIGVYSDRVNFGKYDRDTIKTSIPGLGLRIYWPTSDSSVNSSTNYFPFNRQCKTPCNVSQQLVVEFVKMSGIRTGKISKNTEIATVVIRGRDNDVNFMRIVLDEDIETKAKSCYVKDDVIVDLGNYSIDDLKSGRFNKGGENFQLEIYCDQTQYVGVYYQGKFGSTGKLENLGTAGKGGVSIKLMNEDNSIVSRTEPGDQIKIENGIPYLLNLKAAIEIESKSKLSIGTINADAFITLSVN
ncbi:fimbrial protein [Providencia huaxiensis]|uniref:fimbrial protein n=1 Tax=Providencia TaxID=586 RepID=UPI00200A095F|nr:fimbrial protein [Providencia rettgeri]UPS61511.1 fimbrial protein [Providencia rettgeri]